MSAFYITQVGAAVSTLGLAIDHAIATTVKDHQGRDYPFRLIPGYDPYLSVLVVKDGVLDVYRFDRRMATMSDRYEVYGFDHLGLLDITNELCRNLFSKDNQIVFLKQVAGVIAVPTELPGGETRAIASEMSLLARVQRNSRTHYYDVSLDCASLNLLSRSTVKIKRVGHDFIMLLGKRIRGTYGKRVRVTFTGCLTK